MTWESEVDRYVRHLRLKPASPGYIRNAKGYLTALGRSLGPESFLDLTEEQMIDWLLDVRDHGISGRGPLADASMNSIKGVIKACFRLLNDGKTPKSLRSITVGKNRSRVRAKEDLPTDKEVTKLAKALSVKNRAACLMIRYTGARPSEVLSLKREDISPEFELTFRETKTGEPRTVPLVNTEAVSALKDWLAQAPETEFLFPSHQGGPVGYQSLGKAMKRAAKRIRVKVILPYTLRHARATELMSAPSGLRNRLMGWKSDSMARNYEKLDTGDLRVFLEEREGADQTPVEELQGIADTLAAFLDANPGLGLELTARAYTDEKGVPQVEREGWKGGIKAVKKDITTDKL